MPIRVKLPDVIGKQQLRTVTWREGGSPSNVSDHRLMIVYTGWIKLDWRSDDLAREEVVSFVPVRNGVIDEFKPGNQDLGNIEAVVSASLSAYGEGATVAAVDSASVALEPRSFPSVEGSPLVLILRARIAVQEGKVHGVSYQVTVTAHPSLATRTLSGVNPFSP